MKKTTLTNIMAFMKRATLSGEEVPAFNECLIELNEEYIKEIEKEKAISEKKDE